MTHEEFTNVGKVNYENFKKKVYDETFELRRGFPKEDVEAYLNEHEGDIKFAFEEAEKNQDNQHAYAQGISNLANSFMWDF